MKVCENGDGRPVAAPSKVICRECQKRITETLNRLLTERLTGQRDKWLDEPRP